MSKPEKKFLQEMIIGMLLKGSCNLTEISRTLKDDISIKGTLKRLIRMSDSENILNIANKISLSESKSKITDETILALDTGDIFHQYGNSMENIVHVFDGSMKMTCRGYWLNQISGYNISNKETFPVLMEVYSTQTKEFKSENREIINIIKKGS